MADGALRWAFLLGLLGAIAGSFVAALSIRWPAGRSVMRGRSTCDACGRTLRARDLVPVASMLLLRGRCRDCGALIDRRHLAIELIGIGVGAAAGMTSPGLGGAAGAAFGWLLLALGALDLAALWLPDRLTAILALGGIAAGVVQRHPAIGDRLIGGVAGFALLWVVARGYRLVRGREGMGGGDPKLLGGIGLWLGWRPIPAVLLLASLVGLAVVLFAAMRGRALGREAALPFGVFLSIAAYPAWIAMVLMTP